MAEILVERKDIHFRIEGHVCCTYGTRDAVNRRTDKRNLSRARAQRVYNYLKDKGVNPRRMEIEGLGHQFPLGGEPEFDRRVEIVITQISS
jgi:outer membrane protein OmpA-like peptidoglycan-associated protein